MGPITVDAGALSDALRSELIFLPADGRCYAVGYGVDRAIVTLTPSNPTYWWGNCLRFGHPPNVGDFACWTALFAAHIHAVQPESTHTTFGWAGSEKGLVQPFLDVGFAYFETIVLTAGPRDPVTAPHPTATTPIRIVGPTWDQLLDLLVLTRDDCHSEDQFRVFAARRIAGWRALEEQGQGGWFGIVDDGRLVSALGIYAEAVPGEDGRRIGRFQHVITAPDARRRGHAGTLVAHASRYGFEVLGADALLIAADENDAARRIYQACGYGIATWHRNLERPPDR